MDTFHLLGLPFPFFTCSLGLFLEQFWVRLSIASTKTIPERRKLAVIVVEVQVVHGVAGGPIDDGRIGNILPIMDQNGPDIDEDEEKDVRPLLQWEYEREEVIRQALGEAIDWMESMRGVGCWHDPLVVWFVQSLIEYWMMQAPMYPVNEEVGEENEERDLEIAIPGSRSSLDACDIIQLRVPADFGQEEWGSEDGHYRQGGGRLHHLLSHLIFQEFRVIKGCFIEEEHVRQRRAYKINENTEYPSNQHQHIYPRVPSPEKPIPCYQVQAQSLAIDIIPRYGAHVGPSCRW